MLSMIVVMHERSMNLAQQETAAWIILDKQPSLADSQDMLHSK